MPVRLARVGCKVKRETREFPGPMETRVRAVRTVEMGVTARKGQRVPKALPARKAPEGRKVQRATKVYPG